MIRKLYFFQKFFRSSFSTEAKNQVPTTAPNIFLEKTETFSFKVCKKNGTTVFVIDLVSAQHVLLNKQRTVLKILPKNYGQKRLLLPKCFFSNSEINRKESKSFRKCFFSKCSRGYILFRFDSHSRKFSQKLKNHSVKVCKPKEK